MSGHFPREIRQASTTLRQAQDHSLADALPSGTQRGSLATARNLHGPLELFSIGSNGHIYDIFPDPYSDTGWRSMDVGLDPNYKAVEIVAGNDEDGVMFVAATATYEQIPATFYNFIIKDNRWSYVWEVISNPWDYSKLRTGFGVSAVIEDHGAGSGPLIKGLWGPNPPVPFAFEFGPLAYPILDWTFGKVSTGLCLMFSHSIPKIDNTFQVWVWVWSDSDNSFSIRAGYNSTMCSRISLTPDPSGNGISAVFLLSVADNNIWHVTSDLSKNQQAMLEQISSSIPISEIAASTDMMGLFEVFALGKDGYLYYVHQSSAEGWIPIVPITQDFQVAQLAVGKNGSGLSEVFAVTPDSSLFHIWCILGTTDWIIEEINVG